MFIIWIFLALICGAIGSSRKMGFWGVFFVSLLLSPVVGILVAIFAKSKKDHLRELEMLEAVKRQANNTTPNVSIADELEKIQRLRDAGTISEEEYNKMRSNLLK